MGGVWIFSGTTSSTLEEKNISRARTKEHNHQTHGVEDISCQLEKKAKTEMSGGLL